MVRGRGSSARRKEDWMVGHRGEHDRCPRICEGPQCADDLTYSRQASEETLGPRCSSRRKQFGYNIRKTWFFLAFLISNRKCGTRAQKRSLRQSQEGAHPQSSYEISSSFQCPLLASSQNCHPYSFWVTLHPRSTSLPSAPSLSTSCPVASWPANRRWHPVPSPLARTNPTVPNPGQPAKTRWDVRA